MFRPIFCISQQITQTIRGSVVDRDSQVPLVGAAIIVIGSATGSVTDKDGYFRLLQVPVGRVTLKVTYIGYADYTLQNLLISSAKEEILKIELSESIEKLDEVTINSTDAKGEVLNEMALVSAHTLSVEETQRHAGTFDDPARMAAAFAGVNANAEGNNDIIVRGNSPKGILWRLEGITIPNPNHFASEGSTGGPISALSSKMLANSDFFTGAFAPEYGDATSGVFDMKLRSGNNEQQEYTASTSTLGLDFTAEGPFMKGRRSSYIANYRYSTLALLDKLGVVSFGGVPRYQDLTFKIQLPVSDQHNFSLFGLGGSSAMDMEAKDEQDADIIVGTFSGRNKLGILGLSHIFQINEAMYIRTTAAATGTHTLFSYRIPDNTDNFYSIEEGSVDKTSLILASTFNYKFNPRHKAELGFILTRLNFQMAASKWDFNNLEMVNELSETGYSYTSQIFASWKYRINEALTFINGVHFLWFALNKNYTIEPRATLSWQFRERQSLSLGGGLHSKLEGVSTYYAKRKINDEILQQNKNIEATKALHFVLGYNILGATTHLKIETYYQHLYAVPVEGASSIPFSTLNSIDGYTTRKLVNEGTGTNYGVELTVDRYLHNGLYYKSTLSLFRSLYAAKDGVERSSAFDNNYVANLIGGKEFKVGSPAKNRVFFINSKIALTGGKRFSPIDLAESIEQGFEVTNEFEPFSKKSDDIFRLDFSFGLRRNRKRTSTEFKIDTQNILNNQTVLGEEYVHATRSILKRRQLGVLPTLSYRLSF